ncbi:hypothetical protein GCM10009610_58530 [Pseudonocardia xinjiangensis]
MEAPGTDDEELRMGSGLTPWLDPVLGLACLAVAAFHLVLLGRRHAPVASGAHAAMGLGMAAMFLPSADPFPQPLWVAVFLVSGAWFGAAALRGGSLLDEAGQHVVGAAAMLFMLLGGHGHGAPTATGAVAPEHAHHGGGGGAPGLLVTMLALIFAAWFVADIVRTVYARTAVPVATAPVAVAPAGTTVTAAPAAPLTASVVAHVVMSGAMAVMLLGMA